MPRISDRVTGVVSVNSKRKTPVWKGPAEDGITQSLIGRWLSCRERFRLLVIEGLKASEGWNHRLGYGLFWHICEEAHAAQVDAGGLAWEDRLADHCRDLLLQYPMQREEVEKWYEVCRTQFPHYVEHWRHHPDVLARTPLMQEREFRVRCDLPSGRMVLLRGKFDSVDAVGRGRETRIWLQENKTKGELVPEQIARQLTFDLQTMLYLTALGKVYYGEAGDEEEWAQTARRKVADLSGVPSDVVPISGVRYNCVRRPLSGGKGTIVQKKGSKNVPPESKEAYYARLGEYIREEPDHYFMRFDVGVTSEDVAKFRRECLDPILENVLDDWEWWEFCKLDGRLVDASVFDGRLRKATFPHHCPRHFRHPYGVLSPINEGRPSDLDAHLGTGSEVGLTRVTDLFPELNEGKQ